MQAAVQKTAEVYGRLDFALNNAGIEHGPILTADISEELWDRVTGINLRGVFLCMRYQIPLLLENGGGAIVNTASVAGVISFKAQAAYCAAKYGVVGLTKAAALDYADSNIRINALCPGIIDTPMQDRLSAGTDDWRERVIAMEPVKRMGAPEEVAAAATWLCSDAARFVLGTAMIIDGGQSTGIF